MVSAASAADEAASPAGDNGELTTAVGGSDALSRAVGVGADWEQRCALNGAQLR